MMKYVLIGVILYIMFGINTILGIVATILALAFIIFINRAAIYARKGYMALQQRDNKKALEYYEKAYKTNRASADIVLTYGIMLLRNARPEEAEFIFNLTVLNLKAKAEVKNKAKQYRALTYYKLERADEALEDAKEIFESYKNSFSYGLLGYLMLATNQDLDETYAICLEAYEYNSDDRDICDNMLVCCLRKNELSKAKEISDMMIEKFVTFTETYYHSAILYNKLGDNEKAKSLLEKIGENCTRTYLTTVSEEEIEELKKSL